MDFFLGYLFWMRFSLTWVPPEQKGLALLVWGPECPDRPECEEGGEGVQQDEVWGGEPRRCPGDKTPPR